MNSDDAGSVSAVVTTYNRPVKLRRAIRSVLNQDYQFTKILVVDDHSIPPVDEHIGDLLPELTYLRHENNRGLAAARNTGLSHVRSEYVAFLDDDDIWLPQKTNTQLKQLGRDPPPPFSDQPHCCYSGVRLIDSLDDPNCSVVLPPGNRGMLHRSIRASGLSTRPSSYLFSTDHLNKIGGFDESLPSFIDHDLWLKLASTGCYVSVSRNPLVGAEKASGSGMMIDIEQRLEGLALFLDKWAPYLLDLYGDDSGEAVLRDYVHRSLAPLLIEAIAAVDPGGFRRVLAHCREYSRRPQDHLYLALRFLKNGLLSILPTCAQLKIQARVARTAYG